MSGHHSAPVGTASNLTPSTTPTFETLLLALSQPGAFAPDVEADGGDIVVAQTHASAVLLTRTRAFKLKKPRNFGFLDYSTPALRRHFCALEARLNQALAPGVYLGVAPVLQSPDGALRFGGTLAPQRLPQPGAQMNGGRVIDYSVVMLRLPEESTLAALVQADAADGDLLAEIARRIAAFHARGIVGPRRARYGSARTIAANWAENFDQMRPYIGRTLEADDDTRIRAYVEGFLAARAPLLRARVREGRIRDCHGDLRMEHIYRLGMPGPSDHRLVFVDRIEFLDRFRFGDVAAEVAFLAMELDSVGRRDLSRAFVDAYIAASGDDALRELLPFYACYRAYVRGKVRSFEVDDPEASPATRAAAREQAQTLFTLASDYARNPYRAQLIMVGGLMGVGKSTLAAQLRNALGATLINSDTVRKRLAGVAPGQPISAVFGADIYSVGWNERTYDALLAEARRAIAAGRSVVLDASFARQAQRLAVIQTGQASGATTRFIEAVCPEEVALARLARRWRQRIAQGTTPRAPDAPDAPDAQASDGRPELYAAQASAWEPYDAARESAASHLRFDTTSSTSILRERVLEALGAPSAVCWLDAPGVEAELSSQVASEA